MYKKTFLLMFTLLLLANGLAFAEENKTINDEEKLFNFKEAYRVLRDITTITPGIYVEFVEYFDAINQNGYITKKELLEFIKIVEEKKEKNKEKIIMWGKIFLYSSITLLMVFAIFSFVLGFSKREVTFILFGILCVAAAIDAFIFDHIIVCNQ